MSIRHLSLPAALLAGGCLVLSGCDDRESSPVAGGTDLEGDLNLAETGAVTSPTFVSKGVFGDLTFQDGGTFVTLFVGRGGTAARPETSLFYLVLKCAGPVCEEESGIGLIPNGDLTGNGRVGLSLNTDTSAAVNPNFERISGVGGPIELTWQGNSVFQTQRVFNERTDFGNMIVGLHGKNTATSASITGSIVGVTVQNDAIGSIGTSHGVNRVVERNLEGSLKGQAD